MAQQGVIVAAATRPYPGETENGDAWGFGTWGQVYWVALIDGLGHGPLAAAAAGAASRVLQNHEGTDTSALGALRRCHTALGGTRGAAMALAVIDPVAARLSYAGIGNIEARLWRGTREERPISYRGIVGTLWPHVRAFEYVLDEPWALLMHSDGVRSRLTLADPTGAAGSKPQQLVDATLLDWGRDNDDATIVLVRAAAL